MSCGIVWKLKAAETTASQLKRRELILILLHCWDMEEFNKCKFCFNLFVKSNIQEHDAVLSRLDFFGRRITRTLQSIRPRQEPFDSQMLSFSLSITLILSLKLSVYAQSQCAVAHKNTCCLNDGICSAPSTDSSHSTYHLYEHVVTVLIKRSTQMLGCRFVTVYLCSHSEDV